MEEIKNQERVITDIQLPFKRVLHIVIQITIAHLVLYAIIALPILVILMMA